MDALYDDSIAFGLSSALVSAFQFIFAMLSVDSLNMSASRQIERVRKKFLRAVLRQDMTWYDTNTSTNFASRITEYVFEAHKHFCLFVAFHLLLISSYVSKILGRRA